MLGSLRLLLALLVAISHAEVRWAGLNPGVIAVVGFYLISGYVMTGLVRRHYPSAARLPGFYLDRALRLLPAYYVAALAALAWYLWHGPQPPYLSRIPTAVDGLNNLLVVPMNFNMWNGANRFALVPPSWSLGCEIQFYLLFPLILNRWRRATALTLSVAVYLAAFAGLVHTEWYGYRLLPGVLFLFLIGSFLYDLHHAPSSRARTNWFVALTVAGAIALAAAGAAGGTIGLPYNVETLIGLGLTLPALHLLAPRAPRSWDEHAGNLSYGLFLVHFLVFWMWPGGEAGAGALSRWCSPG
jgi:peptidoglycan/LPS O-acetylase OafA/YrhL